mgnify:CR=1 FL=1
MTKGVRVLICDGIKGTKTKGIETMAILLAPIYVLLITGLVISGYWKPWNLLVALGVSALFTVCTIGSGSSFVEIIDFWKAIAL